MAKEKLRAKRGKCRGQKEKGEKDEDLRRLCEAVRTYLSLSVHKYQHIVLVFLVFRSASKSKGLCCELEFLSTKEKRRDTKCLNNEKTHTDNTALPL